MSLSLCSKNGGIYNFIQKSVGTDLKKKIIIFHRLAIKRADGFRLGDHNLEPTIDL